MLMNISLTMSVKSQIFSIRKKNGEYMTSVN